MSPRTVLTTPHGLRQVDAAVRDEAAVFWRSFEGEPDLDHLSDAARRLLAVAAVLFRRDGAVATSVRDIARAGGVSAAALYNHFDSKQDLLFCLMAHGHARVHRRLDECVRPADAPVAQLTAFVSAYVVGHLEHQWLAQVVRREYLRLTDERLAFVVAQRRSLRDRLAGILRAGADQGAFALPGAPTPVAIMVLDLLTSTTEWYGPREPGDIQDLAALYVTAILRLTGARTG